MKAIELMTTEEKLQTMEALWDSLRPVQDQRGSPEWHGVVLQERAERTASGQAKFSDWEAAKARDCRGRLHEDSHP